MWLENKDGGVKAGVWRADQPVPVREAVPTERAYIIKIPVISGGNRQIEQTKQTVQTKKVIAPHISEPERI